MVSEIKISCRASSVLAGQFWQTPHQLRGASFAPGLHNVFEFSRVKISKPEVLDRGFGF
jgi:hypothetical protein